MVRSRTKLINPPSAFAPSTDELLHKIRDTAMESHALARAVAGELCDTPAGTVPEWIEKLAAMTERATGLTVECIDELERRHE